MLMSQKNVIKDLPIMVMPMCMPWFNFILSWNFIFLCFKLINVHYHTPERRELKIKPRIKFYQHIYCIFDNRSLPSVQSSECTRVLVSYFWAGRREALCFHCGQETWELGTYFFIRFRVALVVDSWVLLVLIFMFFEWSLIIFALPVEICVRFIRGRYSVFFC